ncbi:putative ribonuclease H-like domain-containing protein [Tanacetum coccineum]
MFDIDYLTDSMNYIPVSLENQTNPHAGASEVTNSAGTSQTPSSNASEEKDEDVELIVVPSTVKNTEEKAESRKSSTNSKKEEILTEPQQEKKASSTDTSEDNPKILAFRRELEEIALKHLGRIFDEASYDEEGVITDFNSLPTEIEEEPKKISEALQDESWVQAMQEELLQFKLQQVWVLIDLPHGMKVIGTKWVYRNKRDERGVVVRNKARLVAQGYTQDEGGQSFVWILQALEPWYATLSTFLEKHGYKRGTIGQTIFIKRTSKDIHGGSSDEEAVDVDVTPKTSHLNAVKRIFKYLKGKPNLGLWYPRESPFDLEAFFDSDYGGSNLDRKSTTGGCQFLGQRLISWQCKKQTIVATSTTEAEYVAVANCCGQVLWVQNQLLDYGFNFMNTKIHIDNESTICIVKNLVYHSKTKHIEIRHHFIRDCYEKKLISVEKIHTDLNVADLLTKPFDGPRFNYLVHLQTFTHNLNQYISVSATTFYYYFRFMAQLKYCDKHNQVGFLRKPDESAGFAEIVDFLRGSNLRYALTTNPTIYDSLVKQFWQTATANTLADGTLELHATIDTIVYTITEASIRNKLQLADASGITMLPNNEIFEGMGNMGYPTDGSFTFWKSFFTPQWRFLVHHILHCISSKSGGWDQFGSNIATALDLVFPLEESEHLEWSQSQPFITHNSVPSNLYLLKYNLTTITAPIPASTPTTYP